MGGPKNKDFNRVWLILTTSIKLYVSTSHPVLVWVFRFTNNQAKSLPDATQLIGKIHPFRKIPVTFEPTMQF